MADTDCRKRLLYRYMVQVYRRGYPDWDLKELFAKRDYPIVTHRHIVRTLLAQMYGCSLSELARAEACITGGKPDVGSISNSIRRYMKLHSRAQTDQRLRRSIDDVRQTISLLLSGDELESLSDNTPDEPVS